MVIVKMMECVPLRGHTRRAVVIDLSEREILSVWQHSGLPDQDRYLFVGWLESSNLGRATPLFAVHLLDRKLELRTEGRITSL